MPLLLPSFLPCLFCVPHTVLLPSSATSPTWFPHSLPCLLPSLPSFLTTSPVYKFIWCPCLPSPCTFVPTGCVAHCLPTCRSLTLYLPSLLCVPHHTCLPFLLPVALPSQVDTTQSPPVGSATYPHHYSYYSPPALTTLAPSCLEFFLPLPWFLPSLPALPYILFPSSAAGPLASSALFCPLVTTFFACLPCLLPMPGHGLPLAIQDSSGWMVICWGICALCATGGTGYRFPPLCLDHPPFYTIPSCLPHLVPSPALPYLPFLVACPHTLIDPSPVG